MSKILQDNVSDFKNILDFFFIYIQIFKEKHHSKLKFSSNYLKALRFQNTSKVRRNVKELSAEKKNKRI